MTNFMHISSLLKIKCEVFLELEAANLMGSDFIVNCLMKKIINYNHDKMLWIASVSLTFKGTYTQRNAIILK